MNRVKKEEKLRGKEFPSKPMSSEEWDKAVLGAEEPKLLKHKHLPELPKRFEKECEELLDDKNENKGKECDAVKSLDRLLDKLS